MPRILSRSQMPVPRRRFNLVSTSSSRRSSFVASPAVSRTSSPRGHGSSTSPTRHSLRMYSTRYPHETCGETSIAASAAQRCQQHQHQHQQYHSPSLSGSDVGSESFATALAAPLLSAGGSDSNESRGNKGRWVISQSRWVISQSIWQQGVFGLDASTSSCVESLVSSSDRNCSGNDGRNESGMMPNSSGIGGGFLPTSGLTRNISSGYGHYVEVAEDF